VQSLLGQFGGVVEALALFSHRLERVEELVGNIDQRLAQVVVEPTFKDWYDTNEVAEAMGVSRYTVQEHWCNSGRIECEKDPVTNRWRIPGHEFRRLVMGGGLRDVGAGH
jgi:hypothetical protein